MDIHTDRQFRMLKTIHEFDYVPLSLSDLMDSEFIALIRTGYVERYTAAGAMQMAHLTDKGKELFHEQRKDDTTAR